MASSQVFALSIHADYRCRNSGVCCSVGWDVPVELPVYRSLTEAVTAGRLKPAAEAGTLQPFIVEPDLPDEAGAIFERTDADQCVFFHPHSRLCIVHRDLGEGALPATCRHFPRVAVRDPRGTFVSLSHFCPTAASLLFRDDVALEIVESPPAFPLMDYDGLAVDEDDFPPLLHPRMLMDHESYSAWERHMVERCKSEHGVESILATLARDAAILRQWHPGTQSLADAVRALSVDYLDARHPSSLTGSLVLHAQAMAAVPAELKPVADDAGLDDAYTTLVAPQWSSMREPLTKYLAAKAFATWTAYQGKGVATIVRGLEAAIALARVEASRHCRDAARALDAALMLEAFRSADFILNHLAVGEELAVAWGDVEHI